MTKKILALLLATMLVLSLAACGDKPDDSSNNGDNSNNSSANTEVSGLTEAIAEYPALVTSGGQSADYQMIATVMEKQGMEFTTNNLATSADLGDAKTLIVVVGGSSKGLGAAGIDADGELERLDELMTAAKDAQGCPSLPCTPAARPAAATCRISSLRRCSTWRIMPSLFPPATLMV